ncbi:EmrB/QacA subfamily drug resistance transporter [Friedmanniella endophytica]|uniref:EmrB/QacA subfamily drug resistance transporter n=1 Tax=Microlunatus kandeliicorticis TaxID=1759536 RepID=A0A7W3IPV8_9ACTN|nr:DHA2 family efflux MFS transporter permease subunit [Microlunatus kandeliicorticis]MBA8793056.1 EmrB/QacA subfamily drug resistance transporter [Microlunatus kandeliicorticis]
MTEPLPPAPEGTGLRFRSATGRWVLAATVAGSGMAMLDGTVVNVALARIGAEFGAGFSALQWITNGYTLTLAALILLGGVLGDRYGRRRVFVIGAVWFTVASVLCAAAPSVEVLIAARALQGIGAALLTPGSLAIISAEFAPGDRSRAVGAWSGLGGVASALGPLLGGWLTGIDWRWVFLINVPLAAFVVWAAVRHVPESRGTPSNRPAGHRRLDLPGVILVALALGALTWALTASGSEGWGTGPVLGLVVGLAAGAGFVLVERRTAEPLVRLELFADRTFAVTNLVTLFVYGALSVFFFLLVLQLQVVGGYPPLAAGLSMLPATVLMLVLSSRFGGLADRTGPRPLMAAGALVAAAGFLAALRVGSGTGLTGYLATVLPAVALLGLGLSALVAPLTAAVLGAAPISAAGAASGINNAVARSAGLLAVAVVPAVAGLSALSRAGEPDPVAFDRGYTVSMLIGAGLLVVATAVSALLLPRRVPSAGPPPGGAGPDDVPAHRRTHCAVSGPPPYAEAPSRPSPPAAQSDRRG